MLPQSVMGRKRKDGKEIESNDKQRKQAVMKLQKFMIVCACTLVVCSCGQGKAEKELAQQERDSLQRVIDGKDAELDDIMGTFNEVQEGIRRISEAEGRVTIADATRENASSRELIRENLDYIEQAMKQNRDMVAQLKEKLHNSNIKAEKLQKAIANLQSQIEQQQQRIQELEASLAEKDEELIRKGQEISELNDNVSALEADNQSKSKSLAAQEKQLNEAWFVFGTKSELKEQKILASGDVLKDDNFNRDYFTQIDIRYDKEVKLYSKSAKLLTTHPSGSYNLVKDAQGQYELHITDPKRFWSVTRYLVVQVR